jgi:hypothetical protein
MREHEVLRYANDIHLIFANEHLYLISVWVGEDKGKK